METSDADDESLLSLVMIYGVEKFGRDSAANHDDLFFRYSECVEDVPAVELADGDGLLRVEHDCAQIRRRMMVQITPAVDSECKGNPHHFSHQHREPAGTIGKMGMDKLRI